MSDGFQNVLAVVEHLQAEGYKVSKSAAYKHHREGKLVKGKDGAFSRRAVHKYARTWLSRLDGTREDDVSDELQRTRLAAESRKAEAQAEHWELKTKVARGELVPAADVARMLAARALVLKTDLENHLRGQAPAMCRAVSGDPERIPDLIEMNLKALAGFLARYAEDREHSAYGRSRGDSE